jgi:alpha-1,3/alpha-1,6-mannosyltransferase
MTHTAPRRIAILHLDLGIGGAERLIVDAAVELQQRGHHVTIFAGSYDPTRAFAETRDGTVEVRACGARIPAQVFGRLRVPLAIAKMVMGAIAILRERDRPDIVLCDIAPHVIPLFRSARRRLPVVFYCHFPDRHLTGARRGWYRLYRVPIDLTEAVGTASATAVAVNSRYTARVFADTYPRIADAPTVVYPGVDATRWRPRPAPLHGRHTIVSVARFERVKNVRLAVRAFAALRDLVPAPAFAPLRLIIAGGFDPRRAECDDTLRELRALAASAGVAGHVDFLPSCPDDALKEHLGDALAVVFTPEHEHFGYVPVEAMACGRPVIAVDSGGPSETVVHEQTGLLVPPTVEAFAEALARLVRDPDLADRLGTAGRERVLHHFTRQTFGAQLTATLDEAIARHAQRDSARDA